MTGHVWIKGVQTIQITGKPITSRLPPGEAKAVREKWARDGWTLYVDPSTYLPVRITGWNVTSAARRPARPVAEVRSAAAKPTAANIAKATITIPPGFRQVARGAPVAPPPAEVAHDQCPAGAQRRAGRAHAGAGPWPGMV